MILATRMGDGWLWYGLGIMLLIDGGPQRFSAIGAAGSAAVFGIFVFKALKRLSHGLDLASSSRIAGRKFCLRTSFRFRLATP